MTIVSRSISLLYSQKLDLISKPAFCDLSCSKAHRMPFLKPYVGLGARGHQRRSCIHHSSPEAAQQFSLAFSNSRPTQFN